MLNVVNANESLRYPNLVVASHMTPREDNLLSKSLYNSIDRLRVGNGTLLQIKHVGSFQIFTTHKPLAMMNVLPVPFSQM